MRSLGTSQLLRGEYHTLRTPLTMIASFDNWGEKWGSCWVGVREGCLRISCDAEFHSRICPDRRCAQTAPVDAWQEDLVG